MRLFVETDVFSANDTTLPFCTNATTQLFMFSASVPSSHVGVMALDVAGAEVESVMWTVRLPFAASPPLLSGAALSEEQAVKKASTSKNSTVYFILKVFIILYFIHFYMVVSSCV